MNVSLNYTKFGDSSRSLIILHGLFGSSKNWMTFAKNISEEITVYALDLRNHGDSPHTESHTLNDLREDLKFFIEEHNIQNPVILGHSMGGLAVMALALKYPETVKSIIIEDIAPKKYISSHENEFRALGIDVSNFSSRTEIDRAMSRYVENQSIRQFLQMNLERKNDLFRWKLNVPVLEKSNFIEQFSEYENLTYPGPSLFVSGVLSHYVKKNDHQEILKFFPGAEIRIIPDGDHWLHYSSAEEFLNIVKNWIELS